MAMIQNSPSGLLSLPNEILGSICAFAVDKEPSTCGKYWLLAVRHTCKHLYPPATEELAKRCFTKVHVMESRQSLQELVDLCKHDLVGPYIQEVIFHPYHVDDGFLSTIQYTTRSLATRNDFEGITEARRAVDHYFTMLEDDMHLEESGDIGGLLKRAFGALRRYQGPIKLTVTTRESFETLFAYRQWGGSRSPANRKCSSYVHRDVAKSLLSILEAASATGCHIHPLKIKLSTPLAASRSEKAIELSGEAARAVCRLKSLELDIVESFPSFATLDKTLEAALSRAEGLEGVILCSNSEDVLDTQSWELTFYISQAIETLKSQALRRIWLREIPVFSDGLQIMLKRHKNTLRELTFSDVLLVGSWDKFLLKIKDQLSLDKLVMINLFAVDEDEFEDDARSAKIQSWLSGGVELYGHENVTAGIDEVLGQWNRKRADPDYRLSWRCASDMGHLAYPEDQEEGDHHMEENEHAGRR